MSGKLEELELFDETIVKVRPLPIFFLKKFLKAWEGMDDVGDDYAKGLDVFITCAGIGLAPNFIKTGDYGDKFEQPILLEGKGGKWISDEYREYLEINLDTPDIYLVLEIAGDIKLGANFQRQAAEVMEEMEQAG